MNEPEPEQDSAVSVSVPNPFKLEGLRFLAPSRLYCFGTMWRLHLRRHPQWLSFLGGSAEASGYWHLSAWQVTTNSLEATCFLYFDEQQRHGSPVVFVFGAGPAVLKQSCVDECKESAKLQRNLVGLHLQVHPQVTMSKRKSAAVKAWESVLQSGVEGKKIEARSSPAGGSALPCSAASGWGASSLLDPGRVHAMAAAARNGSSSSSSSSSPDAGQLHLGPEPRLCPCL
eukprot:6481665-Amphidinium_carterae.1